MGEASWKNHQLKRKDTGVHCDRSEGSKPQDARTNQQQSQVATCHEVLDKAKLVESKHSVISQEVAT